MRKFRTLGALALLGVSLAACASIPEIPYDRSSATDIKTIGVVTPSFPDNASVVLASTPGQSFGLIGALIDAGIEANHESRLKAVLDKEKFSAKDMFLQRLTSGLEARGYTVVPVAMTRTQADFATKYPTDDAPKVDAYLDLVTSGYGYAAAGIQDSTPYRPSFVAKVRLVRAKDSSVLMQDVVAYNPIGPAAAAAHAKSMVTVAPDPGYQFSSFDGIENNPDLATRGLAVAIDQSAKTVSDLLK